jgi:hypothetical protein
MSGKYYVIGGEYADTNFAEIADGQTEQRFGPYDEHEARNIWRALTGRTVDNAMVRYRIRPEAEILGVVWYVAGGEYADTDFHNLAEGQTLESYGPFDRAEARAVWRAMTSKSVDNAMVRYNIVNAEGLEALKKNC